MWNGGRHRRILVFDPTQKKNAPFYFEICRKAENRVGAGEEKRALMAQLLLRSPITIVRKTNRSSCKHHFMFMEFLTSLISTIDKRMDDSIYTRRDASRPELTIELKLGLNT